MQYCANFVYENGSLRYILNEEGKLDVGTSANYQFFIKDHLGNTRVVLAEGGNTVTEVNHYYPFGMRMDMTNLPKDPYQKYLYNGKELQDETDWLDYGARFYDAAIARWHCIDPLAESYYSQSSYHFSGNNPINMIDDNGMSYDWFENELTGDVYYNSEYRKGDESKIEGEGWKHMGENNMFSKEGDPISSDLALVATNENLTSDSKIEVSKDGKFQVEASFKGDKAKTFMKKNGYESKPTQQTKYTKKFTVAIKGAPRQPSLEMQITEKIGYKKNSSIATSSGYISPIIPESGPLSYEYVGRVNVHYTNNTLGKSAIKINNIVNPSSPVVYNSWSEYNGSIKLINLGSNMVRDRILFIISVVLMFFLSGCNSKQKNPGLLKMNSILKEQKVNFGIDYKKANLLNHFPDNIKNNGLLLRAFPPCCPPSFKYNAQFGHVYLICKVDTISKCIHDNFLDEINYFDDGNIIINLTELRKSVFPVKKCNLWYANKYPIPYFESFDFGLGEKEEQKVVDGETQYNYIYNIPNDLQVRIIGAESGNFWKENCNEKRPATLKEWQNGYSKGIAISEKENIIMYWTMIW